MSRKKFSSLSIEEEIELAERWQEHGDQFARDKLYESLRYYVINYAKRYRWSGIDLHDIEQEGNKGLVRAIDRFDSTRGVRLITYATWWMRRYISEFISRNYNQISPTRNDGRWKVQARLADAEWRLRSFGEPITASAVAKLLGVNEKYLAQLHPIISRRAIIPLDAPLRIDSEQSWGDLRIRGICHEPEETVDLEKEEKVAVYLKCLSRLNEQERTVLLLRYHHELTLDDVAKRAGVTRERIRQIQKDALRKVVRMSRVERANGCWAAELLKSARISESLAYSCLLEVVCSLAADTEDWLADSTITVELAKRPLWNGMKRKEIGFYLFGAAARGLLARVRIPCSHSGYKYRPVQIEEAEREGRLVLLRTDFAA